MFVAIENLGKLSAEYKVLVLGDMFEMGQESAAEHEAVIRKALETPVSGRIFIGAEFYKAKEAIDYKPSVLDKFYPTAEDAIIGLKMNPIKNATILIKGSRGMALERLVELF